MSADDEGQGGAPTLTHPQCVNRLKEIRDAMSQIAELNEPSAEDDRYFAELRDEFDRVDGYRKNLERQADLARIESAANGLSASRGLRVQPGAFGGAGVTGADSYDRDSIMEPDSIEAQRFRDPWKLDEMRTWGRPDGEIAAEYRARALSAMEKMSAATDRIRSAATGILEEFDDERGSLSQLALALSDPIYLRAWSKLARDPQSADLTDAERRSITSVKSLARAMSLTDSAGGYLVPFQLDPTVILTSDGSRNDIRMAARQVVATGDVWHGVSSAAVSWSYDSEAAEVSDDATTFAQPSVPIYTARGFVPISFEALQDAPNVTAEVGRLLAQGKDDLEATAFATGDGSGKPTGIVTGLVAASATVASAGTDTFAIADVHAVHDAVPARYRGRPGAAWLANNKIYSKIRQFDTAGGAGMWARLGEGRPEGLINRRVLEAEAMDGVINASADNYVLIFGDMEGYVIADRVGTSVEFIPHLFGASQRPTGQRGWFAHVRHGAAVVNPGGLKILNVT